MSFVIDSVCFRNLQLLLKNYAVYNQPTCRLAWWTLDKIANFPSYMLRLLYPVGKLSKSSPIGRTALVSPPHIVGTSGQSLASLNDVLFLHKFHVVHTFLSISCILTKSDYSKNQWKILICYLVCVEAYMHWLVLVSKWRVDVPTSPDLQMASSRQSITPPNKVCLLNRYWCNRSSY